MHGTLQKSKGNIGATVKLSSAMILKTITNEQRTPKQKPVNPSINRGIS